MRIPTAIAALALSALTVSSMSGTQAQAPSRFPVTITNCGVKTTYKKMPERVVTTYSVTTEIMLRLGLGGRIVGAASYGEPLPSDLEGAYQKLNLIGKDYNISKEVMVSLRPDLVFDNEPVGTYDAGKGSATQADLRASGANIYTVTAKCGGGVKNARLEDIYTDLTNIGRLFGVEEKARAVSSEISRGVAAVRARIASRTPVKALIFEGGEGPFTVYGTGTWGSALTLAGGSNVIADLNLPYANLSAEEIAARDIEAFVVIEYDGKAAERAEFLFKTFPNSKAAKSKRWVAVDYELVNPGIRAHKGVEAIARGLYPDAFKR